MVLNFTDMKIFNELKKATRNEFIFHFMSYLKINYAADDLIPDMDELLDRCYINKYPTQSNEICEKILKNKFKNREDLYCLLSGDYTTPSGKLNEATFLIGKEIFSKFDRWDTRKQICVKMWGLLEKKKL